MVLSWTFLERLLHRLHLLPTPLLDSFGAVLYGRALAIGVRRGLFEAVTATPKTADEIARATNMSVKGVLLLADAFVAGGYLTRHGNTYALRPEGSKWLVKSSPFYLGNLIRHFETLYDRWTYLEQTLDHGDPPRRYYESFTDDDWKVYVLAMRDLARLLVGSVRKRISFPSTAKNILDLGGSHGLYAMDCCRRYPNLHARIIDFPQALKHTADLVREEGMEGRVTLVPGDFMKMELLQGQDGILLFNIIHGLTGEENAMLITRCLKALVPGGKLYILDQMKVEGGKSALAQFVPLMVGLNLLNEIGGNAYTIEQVKSWCKDATALKVYRLAMPGVSLIEVTK